MENNENIHPHPLTVDLVVPEVLRHVPSSIQNLLVFRQVCRLWRQFATPIISSRNLKLPLITFKEEGAEAAGAGLSSLTNYMDYLESELEPKITFSNFHFDGISMDRPIVERFVEGFGRNVKKLYLNKIHKDFYSNEQNDEDAEEGAANPLKFRRLLLSCPELEELVLGCDQEEIGSYGFLLPDDDFKTKIKRVAWIPFKGFQHLNPNDDFVEELEKVCHRHHRRLSARNLDPGFTRALSQSTYVTSLKELRINRGNEAVFRILLHDEFTQNLRLRKIAFGQIGINEGQDFGRFLDYQKSSLEFLDVSAWTDNYCDDDDDEELPPIQFPDVMQKLSVLRIGEFHGHGKFERLRLRPLDFKKQLPVLKTLILGGQESGYDLNLFAPGMDPHTVLDGLELPAGIKTEDLRNFPRLFPNVKKLQLRDVDEVLLRVLWEQWSQMESLTIHDVEKIETSLTGLSEQQISVVDSLIKNGQEINIVAEHSSILNLQNLKELDILRMEHRSEGRVAKGCLTDVSIHYTLSKLQKLEYFAVRPYKFTERGINYLCNTRGLKWNKEQNWQFQCQKDLKLEYDPRPNSDEDFEEDVITWDY